MAITTWVDCGTTNHITDTFTYVVTNTTTATVPTYTMANPGPVFEKGDIIHIRRSDGSIVADTLAFICDDCKGLFMESNAVPSTKKRLDEQAADKLLGLPEDICYGCRDARVRNMLIKENASP